MKKTRALIERFLYSAAYPFLFSIYFVLRMYEPNAHGIPPKDLIRPLLISVLVTTAFFLLFLRLVRRPQTAALMTCVLILAFYLYSLAYAVLPLRKYMPSRTFAILWGLTAILLVVLLAWRLRVQPNRDMIAGINLMAFILLMFPIVQLSVNAVTWILIPPPKVSHAIDRDLLYPTIPPVNSFRIVFNTYFGTHLPLLEDINYFSDRYKRYDFSVIPNDCTP